MPLSQSDPPTGTIEHHCLVCDAPARADSPLCSRECVRAASDEISANTLQLRIVDPNFHADQRAALATRNGSLTSALIRWHPE